ncbi:hypothetical protein [Sulfolobus islandicus rod-shaped virus 2]|uniref:Uncharacterized protein n=1 Tax=Sulfolobus islandicus rod-shaped virus 2 TaxID=157899 RepID=Q8V9R0_SIRV2|nr:hypothetical protein SIRV2gp08 [Sulfolobus islandicus rod-shaped virus 2]CAC87283.1 hypothetical protein [Sulfolobus islandicus rod-shaped virus 2]
MSFSYISISDKKMISENVKKLKEMINSFIKSEEKEKEIEFNPYLILNKSETIEAFGREKNSILTTRFDLWINLLFFDKYKILVIYENPDDKKFIIHKIKLIKN